VRPASLAGPSELSEKRLCVYDFPKFGDLPTFNAREETLIDAKRSRLRSKVTILASERACYDTPRCFEGFVGNHCLKIVAQVRHRSSRPSPGFTLSIATDRGESEGRVRDNILVEQLGESLQVARIAGREQLLKK
jgi:hypothetical protein